MCACVCVSEHGMKMVKDNRLQIGMNDTISSLNLPPKQYQMQTVGNSDSTLYLSFTKLTLPAILIDRGHSLVYDKSGI